MSNISTLKMTESLDAYRKARILAIISKNRNIFKEDTIQIKMTFPKMEQY